MPNKENMDFLASMPFWKAVYVRFLIAVREALIRFDDRNEKLISNHLRKLIDE